LTVIPFPKRKSKRALPRLLFQALQEALETEVSSGTEMLKSGLGAPEILCATQMINKLLDFLLFFLGHPRSFRNA
jgi:hypothetical protein